MGLRNNLISRGSLTDDVKHKANLMVADLVVANLMVASEDLLTNRSALLQTAVAICLLFGSNYFDCVCFKSSGS